ncbi:MAG: hypothetical protein AAGN66_29960 [Acidobacteriota bacterium]
MTQLPDSGFATNINVHNDLEDDIAYEVEGGRPEPGAEGEKVPVGAGEVYKVNVDPNTTPELEHRFTIFGEDGKPARSIVFKAPSHQSIRLRYHVETY